MAGRLDGRQIAFLVANEGVEQVELTEPWKAVEAAGGQPVLIAPRSGPVQAYNHLDKGDAFVATISVKDADPGLFEGIVLPGGVANPDQLRTQPEAVDFVRLLAARGVPIAVICHGPWTLVEAGLAKDRTLTSWPSLQTDIRNAGGRWVDEEVVDCTSASPAIVSSRKPDDLPAFCATLVERFASAGSPQRHEAERR